MTELIQPESAPEAISSPEAAELSESGHWAETQVIQSIKEANFRRKDPRRSLKGEATQALGGMFHPVVGDQGTLVTPKRRLRTRLKRIFGYFKA